VLETAKRELVEEIGKAAESWKRLTSFYTSPGFADEEVHVYLATDLSDAEGESEEEERIEIEAVPLAELDDAIARCRDAKSLIGLLWARAFEGLGR
jgi:8-oxo-dGTP pyrophosphatase MutT (NUDIX family)